MKASIIIPTYNKYLFLDLTLSGFLNQTFKDFEIVIVDDGSTDKTNEVVKYYMRYLDIVYHYQNNKGRAEARNIGIQKASGELFIFCDDDRIPSKEFVEEHVCAHLSNDNIVTIGYKKEIVSILSSSLKYKASDLFEIVRNKPKLIENVLIDEGIQIFTRYEVENDFNDVINKYGKEETVDNFSEIYDEFNSELERFEFGWVLATTANLGVRKVNIKNVTFDDKYKEWGMEDTNFSYELSENGCNFMLLKNAINYHQIHEKDVNYNMSLRKNITYFNSKYNTLKTSLFVLLMYSDIEISEVNNIYTELKDNTESVKYKSYLVLAKKILETHGLNLKYIS